MAHGAVRGRPLAERERGVVLDRRVPEVRAQQRRVQRQRAEQPVKEVEQVHALVDELAAARALRLQRATRARSPAGRRGRSARGDASPLRAAGTGPAERRARCPGWKRWLKPTLTSRLRVRRPRRRSICPTSAEPGRLLHQHVGAALERLHGERRELVVRRRDDRPRRARARAAPRASARLASVIAASALARRPRRRRSSRPADRRRAPRRACRPMQPQPAIADP